MVGYLTGVLGLVTAIKTLDYSFKIAISDSLCIIGEIVGASGTRPVGVLICARQKPITDMGDHGGSPQRHKPVWNPLLIL
jgi:hypothetical protein